MNQITHLDPTTATGPAKALFDGVQAKMGAVPNLFRVLGNAPAALRGYLDLNGALSQGAFSAQLREQIALTVAETNQCGYCLSAHTFLGGRMGLNEEAIAAARNASALDARTDAILKFARLIVIQRGVTRPADLQAARGAGLKDGDIIEVIANVAVNVFSNYVNHVAGTTIDFPEVQPGNRQGAEATV